MDSILSVRINEDLKNKFLSLAEEAGTNNKEFMDLIIRSYEMNKTASKTEYVKDDVDELQNIIARIMSIYTVSYTHLDVYKRQGLSNLCSYYYGTK